MFDMRLNSHSRLNLITRPAGGDRGRRRRGADARPARPRLQLQRHQLLLGAGTGGCAPPPASSASTASPAANVIALCRGQRHPDRAGRLPAGRRCTRADEAFVTGTFGGLTPVREIDGHVLPAALPGPVTHAAAGALRGAEGRRRAAHGVTEPVAHRHVVGAAQHLHGDDARRSRTGPTRAVVDEPFYAAYLAATGLDHPMRDEVLASQPHGLARRWREHPGPGAGRPRRSSTRST